MVIIINNNKDNQPVFAFSLTVTPTIPGSSLQLVALESSSAGTGVSCALPKQLLPSHGDKQTDFGKSQQQSQASESP